MKRNRATALASALVLTFCHLNAHTIITDTLWHEGLRPGLIAVEPLTVSLKDFFTAAEKQIAKTDPSFFSRAFSPFIKEHYNATGYSDHLSRDGRHLSEFLQLTNEYNLSTEQTYTGLRLFKNKLGEAPVIDDTVTTHVLETLSCELERHFPLSSLQSSKQKTPAKMIENILLTEFTDHLEKPKQSTDAFFTDLSQTLAKSVKEIGVSDQQAMRDRLRMLALQCAQHLIEKTVWFAQQPESIWPSFLKIAHHISLLCSHRIIQHLDDADDLYKLLISRFTFFIDQVGQQLPLSWFENIESDIRGSLVPFLESPELDSGITSKKELLLQALAGAKMCAIAQQEHGLLLE